MAKQVSIPFDDDLLVKYRSAELTPNEQGKPDTRGKVTIEKVVLLLLTLALVLAILLFCYHQLVIIARTIDAEETTHTKVDVPVPAPVVLNTSGDIDFSTNDSEEYGITESKISDDNEATEIQIQAELQTTEVSPVVEDTEIVRRREFIKSMTTEAWNAYVTYAWASDSLRPLTRNGSIKDIGPHSGRTIMTSLSTLWLMGLKDQFELGKQWIKTRLDLSQIDNYVFIHVIDFHYVCTLVSLYALTGEWMFVQKAAQIAKLMEPAYVSPTGLSYQFINPKSGKAVLSNIVLSELGGKQLQLLYLSDLTGEKQVRYRMDFYRKFVKQLDKPEGLYYETVNITTGRWTSERATLSLNSKMFFSSLLKSYVQSGGRDVEAVHLYADAMDAIERNGLFVTSRGGHLYARDHYLNGTKGDFMTYESCYLGSLLVQGASALESVLRSEDTSVDPNSRRYQMYRINRHYQLAEQLTETCHLAASRTVTGLAPEKFFFTNTEDGVIYADAKRHLILPQLAESYLMLWRKTHDSKYREYAWQLAQSIHAHCRTESGGYTGVIDVNQVPTEKAADSIARDRLLNSQPPNFIASTLKYLYLTFTDDRTVLPLDQWLLSDSGQPLPICGHNDMYPKEMCQ